MLKNNQTIIFILTLISIAVLGYELTQIRIFSFSLHPIIAYTAISLAMLGFGLGATLLAIKPGILGPRPIEKLHLITGTFGIVIVLVNVLFARTSTLIIPAGTLDVQIHWISIVLLPCVVPYFLAGLTTTIVFQHGVQQIGRLYFWNLTGSAVGAATMILILPVIGAPSIIILCATFATVCATAASVTKKQRIVWSAVTVGLATLITFPAALFPFQPDVNGHVQLFEKEEILSGYHAPKTELTMWDPIGRIDILKHTRDHLEVKDKIDYRVVTIDGGAMTLMLEEKGEPGTWGKEIFGESLYASAYHVKKNPDVLVIGSGGGSDIETALYWQSKSVVGVEISQSTLKAVTGPYADFVGWTKRDNVETYFGDGRAYAKSTEKRFDLIQMSGVDTMTMHTSGSAMVAAEDYLYTVDAFEDFLSILKPDGVLSVMRFGDQSMNLSMIASIALRSLGVEHPEKSIVALKQANLCGILIKRTPFRQEEIDALRAFASRRHENDVVVPIYDSAAVRLGAVVDLVYPQGTAPSVRYEKFFKAVAIGEEEQALKELGHAFVTPTDDRPYYILGTFVEAMQRGGNVHPGLKLLLISTAIISAASLLLILLPAVFIRRKGPQQFRPLFSVILYFFSIGAGFMLLEIGLIHRATVFVSTPGAAVAVVLSSILISSGLGSLLTDRLKWPDHKKLLTAICGLILVSIFYRLFAEPVFDALFGLPLWARCLMAAASLAPAGFFMGWFFPIGLKTASAHGDTLVPWGIGVNGFASVIGSLAALYLGIKLGLTGAFIVALIGYILAVAFIFPFVKAASIGSNK